MNGKAAVVYRDHIGPEVWLLTVGTIHTCPRRICHFVIITLTLRWSEFAELNERRFDLFYIS